MFVRFSKTRSNKTSDFVRMTTYRRAVRIGNSILVQDGDDIVAFAMLNSDKVYEVYVKDDDNKEELEKYTKRFIVNSAKWEKLDEPKRKYEVYPFDLNKLIFDINVMKQ